MKILIYRIRKYQEIIILKNVNDKVKEYCYNNNIKWYIIIGE